MKDKIESEYYLLHEFLERLAKMEKSPEWDYEYSSGHTDGQIDLAKEILNTFFND